jgi:hypothetical protein
VEVEILAVGEPGQQQRVQLQLRGSIPGTLPNRDSRDDADALEQLEPQFYVLLASVLLWMFRGEGVLTQHNAWGVLRDVRPTTAASASSSQGSG